MPAWPAPDTASGGELGLGILLAGGNWWFSQILLCVLATASTVSIQKGVNILGPLCCKEIVPFGLMMVGIFAVVAISNGVILSCFHLFWGPPLGPTTSVDLSLLLTLVEASIFAYASQDNHPTPEPPEIG